MHLEVDAPLAPAPRERRRLRLERVRRRVKRVDLVGGDQAADHDPSLARVVAPQRAELALVPTPNSISLARERRRRTRQRFVRGRRFIRGGVPARRSRDATASDAAASRGPASRAGRREPEPRDVRGDARHGMDTPSRRGCRRARSLSLLAWPICPYAGVWAREDVTSFPEKLRLFDAHGRGARGERPRGRHAGRPADAPIRAMMREPATVDERAPLLRGAGSGFNRRGASIRGCLDDVSRVASNRWFRAAMVAKSAFFTLGTVILLHHGTSMSTGRTRREGNGYLEVPAEAHFAPLWSGDHLRHHPAADDLNVAWFPVHRGRFVMDQAAERAKDAARGGNHAKDDRMPKWPKHVIGGDDWADLGVVAMSGAVGGAREKQPEFWFHAVPGDVPVVSMDVRGHGESERGWNALSVDDAFDAVRWNLMANDVLAQSPTTPNSAESSWWARP